MLRWSMPTWNRCTLGTDQGKGWLDCTIPLFDCANDVCGCVWLYEKMIPESTGLVISYHLSWGGKASHQERWILFEEFIQSKEDWGNSVLLASIRANKEHERRGKYQLMSREVSWLYWFFNSVNDLQQRVQQYVTLFVFCAVGPRTFWQSTMGTTSWSMES